MKSSRDVRRYLLALAVVVAAAGLRIPVASADAEAAARKHAAKANQLAARNKCKQALPWYNRAYRTLKDPTLLFNRAECLRKLGENHDAVRDYELFLSELPTAPNRASVEERIASLLEVIKAGSSAGEGSAAGKGPAAASPAEPTPAAKEAEKPPAAAEKPAVPAAVPVEQAPSAPVRRAEKWTD